MKLTQRLFDDVLLLERPFHEDERGVFSRLFCQQSMNELGLDSRIVQINYASNLQQGTLRGMHFQHPPAAETKYVSCVSGQLFDVVVDLRVGSSTFLQWQSVVLDAEEPSVLAIPAGFAHGYQTLSAQSVLIYGHTANYQPQFEAGLRFDDPQLAIEWPQPVTMTSPRDQQHPLLDESFEGVQV